MRRGRAAKGTRWLVGIVLIANESCELLMIVVHGGSAWASLNVYGRKPIRIASVSITKKEATHSAAYKGTSAASRLTFRPTSGLCCVVRDAAGGEREFSENYVSVLKVLQTQRLQR